MNDLNQSVDEAEDDVTEDNDKEAGTTSQQTEADQKKAIEAEARSMGWRPKGTFKDREGGEGWMDAEAFLQVKKSSLKHVNTELRKRDEQIDGLYRTIKALQGSIKGIEAQSYERALADLRQQQQKAFEDGDREALLDTQEQMEKLLKDVKEEKKESGQKDEYSEEFEEFASRNRWATDTKSERYKYAVSVMDDIADEYGHGTEEFYEELEQTVKSEFARRREEGKAGKVAPRPVLASADNSSGNKQAATKGVNDLPREARDILESVLASAKTADQKKMVQKQYIDDYFGAKK